MSYDFLELNKCDPSWRHCLDRALQTLDRSYLANLMRSRNWLPGPDKIFNAFSQPLDRVKYLLFGESPYPRQESANGFAFWDASVDSLWSPTGLSKKVNRATSLRNIIKMLLIAEGLLHEDNHSQEAISQLKKEALIQTNDELFNNFLQKGFLLLNATPVLTANSPQIEARAWQPFIQDLLACLYENNPQVELILFGRIANTLDKLIPFSYKNKLYAEHPYNYSFITNPSVLAFFKPLHLLKL